MGEAGFRKLETRYLKEVCELYKDFILSTGGGTPCFNDNMEYMNAQGHTIFLDTDVDTITERLIRGKHKRPMVSHLAMRRYAISCVSTGRNVCLITAWLRSGSYKMCPYENIRVKGFERA